MRHRKSTFKINRTGEHRRALLANMACSLFKEGRISTILTRAKVARRLAEKMITLGKDALPPATPAVALAARRRAIAAIRQKDVVRKLFAEIAPKYAARQGGYTRIIHIGRRLGDAADMCFLELVTDDPAVSPQAEEAVAADKKA